jgi:hypothetical protein
MPAKPTKSDIFVYEENGVFYARPSPAIVDSAHGVVRVRNLTGRSVKVTFPFGVVAVPPPRGRRRQVNRKLPHVVGVTAGRTRRVPLGPAASGIHTYQVQVTVAPGIKALALGHSAPKLIVDP